MPSDRWSRRHMHLQRRKRNQNSRLVEVRRDGSFLFSAYATVSELRIDEKIDFGVSLDVRRMDFVFSREDIPINYNPGVDDSIHDATDPVTGIREGDLNCNVSPLGEAVYRWTTSRRTAMRIHASVPAYSIGDLSLQAINTGSIIGQIVVTITDLPLVTLQTLSTVGVVSVEAELDTIHMDSAVGELNPEEEIPVTP